MPCHNFFTYLYLCHLTSVYKIELKWKLREGLLGRRQSMLYFLKYQRLLNRHVNPTRKVKGFTYNGAEIVGTE